MGPGTFIQHYDLFGGDLDAPKVIVKCVFEEGMMGDFGMDAKEMSNHSGDLVAKRLASMKILFELSQSITGAGSAFCKLDILDCFQTPKNTTNCYSSVQAWLSGGWMDKEVGFKSFFLNWEVIL